MVLFSQEYLISYSATVKDALLYNERLMVSKSMTPCKGELLEDSLLLGYAKNSEQNLKELILADFDAFLSYMERLGLEVRNSQRTTNGMNRSMTKLLFPTTCFKVDFNDSFVTITAIKHER